MRRAFVVGAILATAATIAANLPDAFRAIPPDRNGFPLLVQAADLVTHDDHLPVGSNYPDCWEPLRPAVTRHLAVNAPALARLDEALSRPELVWSPEWADQERQDDLYRLCGRWRELARLKAQAAFARQARGDRLGALHEIDDLLTWVEEAQDGCGGDSVAYTNVCTIRAIALGALRPLLVPEPTDAERPTWTALSLRIADESRAVPALQRAYGGELACFERTLRQPELYTGAPPSEADIAAAVGWYRAIYEAAATVAEQPAWQRRSASLWVPMPAAIGRQPEWQAMGIDDGPVLGLHWVDRDRANRRLSVTAIALRLYQADRHRPARDLAEAVASGLLPAVPIDPFDNRPLRYRPEQGTLYSVGDNRVDDSGGPGDQVERLWFIKPVPRPEPLAEATRSPRDEDKGLPEPLPEPTRHGASTLF